jgi:hypothetical protein
MTDCTATLKNELTGTETLHCDFQAGHVHPENGTNHASPNTPPVGRTWWSDTAVGATPHVHRLTDEELLPLMVAAEHRNRQRRREHTVLAYPMPPCTLCQQEVRKQVISDNPKDMDERRVVNEPCGHRMTYDLTAADRLVEQVQRIVDVEQSRPGGASDTGDQDVCTPLKVDGETVRVRGTGQLTKEGEEALTALVRGAKAKVVADAPDQVGVLQNRLRLAHKARRAKEHLLDDIRRALCDAELMQDDDPYSHADLADVIRQAGDQPRRLRERLRLLTDEKVAYVTGPNIELLCEENIRLKAEVAAARGFAGEMREFCSPHGVAADYADRLIETMDRAKEKA